MDTSVAARYIVIIALFICAMVIAYMNLRLIVMLMLKRKVSRAAKIIWPLLLFAAALCVFDAFYIEPNWVQVTRHKIYTSKLPAGSRIRIVQISDIHLDDSFERRYINMINYTTDQRPDVIVLTGDYSVKKNLQNLAWLAQIGERLSNVAPTYVIEGNWDLSSDLNALQNGGVNILRFWTEIPAHGGGKIALGQVPWFSPEVYDSGPESDIYKVLLTHRPRLIVKAAKAKMDLVLVGHTHGGQIRLPIFGALIPDTRLVDKYQAGLYSVEDTLLYVNRGIGLEGDAPKVRFCCRPEVAVFDIVGKER